MPLTPFAEKPRKPGDKYFVKLTQIVLVECVPDGINPGQPQKFKREETTLVYRVDELEVDQVL